MKHLDEIGLAQGLRARSSWRSRTRTRFVPMPKLIIGHTHEPRQNAVFPTDPGEAEPWEQPDTHEGGTTSTAARQGGYENLIWCVEIRGSDDRICSWSGVDGKLKKITWRSEGSSLRHDEIEWFST